jgi:hypothetical protein
VLFILIPALGIGYGFSLFLNGLNAIELQEFTRKATGLGNQIIAEAEEGQFVRNRFQQKLSATSSTNGKQLEPSFEAFFDSENSCEKNPDLVILARMLVTNDEPDHALRNRWQKALGFYFSLELLKKNEGRPIPVKWQKKKTYCIWRRTETEDKKPKVNLLFCSPPTPLPMLKRAFFNFLTGVSGGAVDLKTGKGFFSRGLSREKIRQLLTTCRPAVRRVFALSSQLIYWERTNVDTGLFLLQSRRRSESAQWWIKNGVLAALLVMGTWFYFVLSIKWSFISIRWKLAGIIAAFTIFPLFFVGALGTGIKEQLQRTVYEDWLRTARHELRLLDQDFSEQIRELEDRFSRLTGFSTLNNSLDEVKNRLSAQMAMGWVDSVRMYGQDGKLLLGKAKFGFEEGFAELDQFFADRHISATFPRAGPTPKSPKYLFLDSVLDESAFGIPPEKITPYRFGRNLLYGYWSLLKKVPISKVVFAAISLTHEGLAEKFLKARLLRHRAVRIITWEHQSGTLFPSIRRSQSFTRFCQGVERTREERQGYFPVAGIDSFVLGLPGKNLEGFDLVAVIPRSHLDLKIQKLWQDGLHFLALTLAVSLCGYFHLFKVFLLPIRDVENGLEQAGKGDFQRFIPVRAEDELGAMAEVFNRFIETLSELDQAKAVQSTLISNKAPTYPEYDIAAHCSMCDEIGGDYLDIFPLLSGQLGCIIGDVSGHGVSSALIMAIAKTRVFLHFDTGKDPADLFPNLNESLRALSLATQMMSMSFVLLDNRTHTVELWNAGHPFPIHFSNHESQAPFIGKPAFPLGKLKKPTYQPLRLTLEVGDFLVMYSDGLVEALNGSGQPFTYEKVVEIIKSQRFPTGQELLNGILESWKNHIQGVPVGDDVSLLVIRRSPHNAIPAQLEAPQPDGKGIMP